VPKLKKICPFCKGKGNKIVITYQYGYDYVECRRCGARGPCIDHDGGDGPEQRAIAAWNRHVKKLSP